MKRKKFIACGIASLLAAGMFAFSGMTAEAAEAAHYPSYRTVTEVYDWGPASTESARAALALAAQGYRVRSMLGGFEYWSRLGLGIEGPDGTVKRRAPDPYITTADAGWD